MSPKNSENDKLLHAAVRFLFEGGDKEAAQILVRGEIDSYYYEERDDTWYVILRGSRKLYDVMETDPQHPIGFQIHSALKACLPVYQDGNNRVIVNTRMELVEVDLDWRVRLLAEVETEVALNQNPFAAKPLLFAGMRFNSPPEIEIAKALERAGVMYLPNCLVRAGTPNEMVSRFPDFLICYRGKWGILEVDGQKFHTGRATEDHERSRVIERHGGIAYLTRFDSQRCMNDPNGVVKDFIEILKNK